MKKPSHLKDYVRVTSYLNRERAYQLIVQFSRGRPQRRFAVQLSALMHNQGIYLFRKIKGRGLRYLLTVPVEVSFLDRVAVH